MPKEIQHLLYDRILKELSERSKGLTINELAEICNASRYTIAKVLQRLIGEDRIEVRQVGPAKLHYLKE